MENPGRGLSSGDFGLSANTTVLGFRGGHEFELGGSSYALIYQVEQNFNPGVSEGDTFGNRDTFGGLRTPYGRFRAGLLDTPFKLMGLQFTKLTTTVADPHAILGASSTAGGRLDLRGANSIMWDHKIGNVKLKLQYGFDQNRGSYGSNNDQSLTGTEGVLDDNDNDMYSAGISWTKGDLTSALPTSITLLFTPEAGSKVIARGRSMILAGPRSGASTRTWKQMTIRLWTGKDTVLLSPTTCYPGFLQPFSGCTLKRLTWVMMVPTRAALFWRTA